MCDQQTSSSKTCVKDDEVYIHDKCLLEHDEQGRGAEGEDEGVGEGEEKRGKEDTRQSQHPSPAAADSCFPRAAEDAPGTAAPSTHATVQRRF